MGVEGLLRGHLDNLETPCSVLTVFQMSYDSVYILKQKAIFT